MRLLSCYGMILGLLGLLFRRCLGQRLLVSMILARRVTQAGVSDSWLTECRWWVLQLVLLPSLWPVFLRTLLLCLMWFPGRLSLQVRSL